MLNNCKNCFFIQIIASAFGLFLFFSNTSMGQTPSDRFAGVAPQEILREVILRHPEITSASARACYANYSLNVTRAKAAPQLSGTLESNRSLLSSVDYSEAGTDTRVRDRAFNKTAYNNAVDVVLRLNKPLWDAGKLDYDISADEYNYTANVLRRQEAMSQLLLDLVIATTNLEYANRRLSVYTALVEEMAPHIETIEARVEAGVARFELLRQVKIIALDAEFERRAAENDQFLAQQNLTNQFTVSAQNSSDIFGLFAQNRSRDLFATNAETALSVRIFDLEAQRAAAQNQSIVAEKKPQINLTLDTRFFDLNKFGQEYEVIGGIGLTMPLYDGGANAARQQQTAQSVREALSQRRAEIRNINTEYQRFRQVFADSVEVRKQLQDKKAAQIERKESLLTISDRADVSVLELISLMVELASTTVQLDRSALDNEILFARKMHYADELLSALGFDKGDVTC